MRSKGSRNVILLAAIELVLARSARAGPFTVSYAVNADGTPDLTIGGNWNTAYVQGFSPSVSPNPAPGVSATDPVTLSQFQFYKSGAADTGATNIRLAILNDIFPGNPVVTQTTTTSGTLVGLSTNTIATTTTLNTNDPIAFTFNNLPLIYGNNYAAVYVNVGTDPGDGTGAPLTPVSVPTLVTNYTLNPNDSMYHPSANYGAEDQFRYATSNFINGSYFSTFSFAGDADFRATLNSAAAVTGSIWTGAVNAIWSGGSGGNWSPAGAPNSANATANFGSIASGNYAVALDAGGDTVGNVNFSGSVSYTIGTTAGPNLNLQVTTGRATINDNSGNHTIAAPVKLLSDTTITTLSGTTLTLASPLVTASNTLTVTKNGPGTLQVERVATGTLDVASSGGLVRVSVKANANSAPGTSVLTNLFVGAGGSVDLGNNALILTSNTGGGTATADIVRQMLLSGRITTTSNTGGHALGYADNATLARSTFGGISGVSSSSILVGYTFGGDANLDGKVNSLDFNALAANFGSTAGLWTGGDFDYDGTVGSGDFTLLSGNFNKAMPTAPAPGLGTLVPEPASAALLLIACGLASSHRRARRTISMKS